MKPGRPAAFVRSWLGLAAAAIALSSAAWLTGEYVYAAWVTPADKALVESLKVRAKTDATVHPKLLQPEFDRQRVALERRHIIYRWGGLLLVISAGVFLAWAKWLTPRPGEWTGIPPWLQRQIDAVSARGQPVVSSAKHRQKTTPIRVDPAAVPLKGLTRSQKARYRFQVVDGCNGCTLCAQVCPAGAIEARPYLPHEIVDERCTRCGLCVPVCPEHAVVVF